MDREKVSKAAHEVTDRVGKLLDQLREEFPGLRAYMALDYEGAAVGINFQAKLGKNENVGNGVLDADAHKCLEEQAAIFRRIASGVGRQLYENPLDPQTAAQQCAYVSQVSRGFFERYVQHVTGKLPVEGGRQLCSCHKCKVQEAGTMIATGVRMLDALDVPREALRELQEIARECCRRGHLRGVEREAVGQA